MLKSSSSAIDSLARDMCTAMGNAMGGCMQTTPQFTAWINQQFVDQFAAHNIVGAPVTRSLALGTAYQATDPTKPAIVTVNLDSTASITLLVGTANRADIVVGVTNAVAGGTGTLLGQYRNTNTGALTIGLNLNDESAQSLNFILPVGYYFAIRQITGTITILSAYDQSIG